MDALDPRTQAWIELHDPATTADRLAQLASEHAEFAAQIGAHPNAYAQLREWAVQAAHGPAAGRAPVASTMSGPRSDRRMPRFAVVGWVIAFLLRVGMSLSGVGMNLVYATGSHALVWSIALVGLLAALAGAIGAPTAPRRVAAIAIVVVSGAGVYVLDGPVMMGGLLNLAEITLLFVAWAIAWPLRPLGYAGLPIIILLVFATGLVSSALPPFSGPFATILRLLLCTVLPAGGVAAALLLSSLSRRRAQTRQPQVGMASAGVAYPPSTVVPLNTMALLALIFAFLPTGPLCIVFGHIGLSQIRRTGERGRGMAIAGLILGYLWIVSLIVLALSLAGLLGSLAMLNRGY